MPYIKQELREELEYPLGVLSGHLESMLIDRKEDRAGILNYVITSLIDSVYGPLKDAKYKDYNEAIGMLECCKLEFYRRGVAPYEDLKERENGSVLDSNFPSSKRQGGDSKGDSEVDSDDIYRVELDLNTNVFIRAHNYQNALNILKKILENKRFNYFLYGPYLSKYKSWDLLEPEIKNGFKVKQRDNPNNEEDNKFVIFYREKHRKDFSRKVPTEKGGSTYNLANYGKGASKRLVANAKATIIKEPEQIKIEFEPVSKETEVDK